MKKTIKLLLIVLGTLLFSCDKNDDDQSEPNNYLKIGDTEYDLSAGVLENYGADENGDDFAGYNTDLTLYSSGLSLQQDGDGDWELSGKGHGIYFEMFSTIGTALDSHNYSYTEAEPSPIGTFDDGEYVTNYDTEVEGGGTDGEIISGKVDVKKDGSTYSITIDCTGSNGEKITGFYKGTLFYVDWSDYNY